MNDADSRLARVCASPSIGQADLPGALRLPDHPAWDEARSAFNLAVDQRPAAVLMASGPDGVVEAIAYAREHGLRVAAQSTGHGAAPMGPLDRTLLVRTAGMSSVQVDPVARVARVGAGAT